MKVYTKESLDEITHHGCQIPGCGCGKEDGSKMFVHCAGCVRQGRKDVLEIEYVGGSGIVSVNCRTCGSGVANFELASKE